MTLRPVHMCSGHEQVLRVLAFDFEEGQVGHTLDLFKLLSMDLCNLLLLLLEAVTAAEEGHCDAKSVVVVISKLIAIVGQ